MARSHFCTFCWMNSFVPRQITIRIGRDVISRSRLAVLFPRKPNPKPISFKVWLEQQQTTVERVFIQYYTTVTCLCTTWSRLIVVYKLIMLLTPYVHIFWCVYSSFHNKFYTMHGAYNIIIKVVYKSLCLVAC